MSFVWYNPKAGAPIVSIADYGLTFSGGAVEALGEPEYVVLGFDEVNKVIGVKPCGKDEQMRIAFRSRKRDSYVRISNKDFIRFIQSKMPDGFALDSKSKRYISRWDKEEQMLKIHLDQPMD